ncbi:type 2 lanthipeptide synthetase LanM [Roseibium album]|uniref:type 2 lanthipeptide synthetase LanM n=1 Tax=Roseibium album TaxID=311410 RepID=UPI003298B507
MVYEIPKLELLDADFERSVFKHERDGSDSCLSLLKREWFDALNTLRIPSQDDRDIAIADECIKNEAFCPYAPVFRSYLSQAVSIIRSHPKTASLVFLNDNSILVDTASYLLRLALLESRYSLHISQKSNALNYSTWISQFDTIEGTGWVAVAKDYPVLIRRLGRVYSNIYREIIRIVSRLTDDRRDLLRYLSISESSSICALELGLSDPHRSGQTVARVSMSDGCSVIYKPKSLAIDEEFNRFVTRQPCLGIQAILTLDRGEYGWCEDVSDKLSRSYEYPPSISVGRVAALLWCLNSTDMHFENLVATHDGVRVIDLETLLSGRLSQRSGKVEERWFDHTIGSTLLFDPNILKSSDRTRVGAFNFDQRPKTGGAVIEFEIVDDSVQIRKLQKPTSLNKPHVQVCTSVWVDEAVASFRALLKNGRFRSDLLSFIRSISPSVELRFVARNTEFYESILERCRQPRFMRSADVLYSDLERLYRTLSGDRYDEELLRPIVNDEITQLLDGDVPYFSFEIGETTLGLSNKSISHFFGVTAANAAVLKLTNYHESDVEEQADLFGSLLGDQYARIGGATQTTLSDAEGNSEKELSLLNCIQELSLELVKSATLSPGTNARWPCMQSDPSGEMAFVTTTNTSFFGGYWGIILALESVSNLSIGRFTQENISALLDREAQLWTEKFSRLHSTGTTGIGYTGVGGLVFAWSTLHTLNPIRWGILPTMIVSEIAEVGIGIQRDQTFDVVGGSAGLVLGCATACRSNMPAELLKKLRVTQALAVERLLTVGLDHDMRKVEEKAQLSDGHFSYAHGWAGYSVALSSQNLYCVDQISETRLGLWHELNAVGLGALKRFHDQAENMNKAQTVSWCRGWAGYVRGLLAQLDLASADIPADLAEVIKSLAKSIPSSLSFRYCCGALGIVDLMFDLGKSEGFAHMVPDIAHLKSAAAGAIIASSTAKQKSPLPESYFFSLFQGKAGLIYVGARLLGSNAPSLSGQGELERIIQKK